MRASDYSSTTKLSDDSINEEGAALEETFEEEFDRHGDVIRVANLTFVDGDLGRGSFGTVRLAKRKLEKIEEEVEKAPPFLSPLAMPQLPIFSSFRSPPKTPASTQLAPKVSTGRQQRGTRRNQRSNSEPAGSDFFQNTTSNGDGRKSPRTPKIVKRLGLLVRNPSGDSERGSFYTDKYAEDDSEDLVAVKIFRKSILRKMRTMERNKETRKVQVRTALGKVEREIAIMKKLSHPNVINLHNVLDSPESDMLYLVLEYMPLGEILSYQDDGTFRRKEPREGDDPIPGLLDGHFDEETSALFFVDILHGLAYLHENNVVHRDLKPENILLSITPDGFPVAKLSDFGVAHMFEGEVLPQSPPDADGQSKSAISDSAKHHLDRALSMAKKSNSGILTKTEGTWCFWSPEMCDGKGAFSGYPCDMWAAGICLYIFVSGRLPFFSELPLELMERIAEGEVPYSELNVSDSLLSLLKMTLAKDPGQRAGVGDCLQHPFLQGARNTRISQLSDEFRLSHKQKITVEEDDIRAAFQVVTRIPSVLIKSAAKKVEVAGKRLAQLTKTASQSFSSDQSPASSSRSIIKTHRATSMLSDTSETTNNSIPGQPTILPAIYSDDKESEDQSPASTKTTDAPTEEHHHHRNKLFSSIFRRSRGSGASHELQSKNTC